MKQRMQKTIPILLATLIFAAWLVPPASAGAETFDDALAILNIAIADNDMDALESLINPDLGLAVGGHFIGGDDFVKGINDVTIRELQVYTDDGLDFIDMSVEEFLWGDDEWEGAFIAIDGITLSHYETVDREEIQSDSLIERWEHGELETAVVHGDENLNHVYILPEMIWRLIFVEIDDLWYLSDIDARIHSASNE